MLAEIIDLDLKPSAPPTVQRFAQHVASPQFCHIRRSHARGILAGRSRPDCRRAIGRPDHLTQRRGRYVGALRGRHHSHTEPRRLPRFRGRQTRHRVERGVGGRRSARHVSHHRQADAALWLASGGVQVRQRNGENVRSAAAARCRLQSGRGQPARDTSLRRGAWLPDLRDVDQLRRVAEWAPGI
jgi:hypothetical protein